jgi:hypothetical protein
MGVDLYICKCIYLPYEQADVELASVVDGGGRDGGSDGDPVVGLDEAGAVQVVAPSRLVCVGLQTQCCNCQYTPYRLLNSETIVCDTVGHQFSERKIARQLQAYITYKERGESNKDMCHVAHNFVFIFEAFFLKKMGFNFGVALRNHINS